MDLVQVDIYKTIDKLVFHLFQNSKIRSAISWDAQAVSRMAYSGLLIKTSSAAKVSEELAPVEHTTEPCKNFFQRNIHQYAYSR
jgi:hypothetical protein